MGALGATFVITAYCLGPGAPGPLTASGVRPVAGHTVAADRSVLPIGSIIEIDGVGQRMVQDVGSAVLGRHVDLFMDDCRSAIKWGRQRRSVRVLHVPKKR